jgi:hypothetical protein
MQHQNPAVLPPTPQIGPARVEAVDDMAELGMWRNISDRSEDITKMEKIMNEITDTTSSSCYVFCHSLNSSLSCHSGNTVELASSSDGVVGLVKTVLANGEVEAIGNRILEAVPTLMSALETLTKIHPFLEGASA